MPCMKKINIFYEVLLVLFLVGAFFLSKASITGYVSFPVESIDIEEIIDSDRTFILTPPDENSKISFNSMHITGEVIGTGLVNVFLELKDKSLLVFSNKDVLYRSEKITGLANSKAPSILGAVVGMDNSGVEITIEDQQESNQKEAVAVQTPKEKITELNQGGEGSEKTEDIEEEKINSSAATGSSSSEKGNTNLTGDSTNPVSSGSGGSGSGTGTSGSSKGQPGSSGSSSTQSGDEKSEQDSTSEDSSSTSNKEKPFSPYALPPELGGKGKITVQNKCFETCNFGKNIEVDELKFKFEKDNIEALKYLKKAKSSIPKKEIELLNKIKIQIEKLSKQ